MKKIIISVLLIFALASGFVVAQKVIEQIEDKKIEQELQSLDIEVNPNLLVKQNKALASLKSQMEKGKDVQNAVEAYAYFISVLQPTDSERVYIDNLILKGKDAEALVNIFEFWQDTTEDLSIIEAVYKYMPHPDYPEKYWVDNAFIDLANKGITKNQYSNLSYDDVKEYSRKGLSYDELRAADKMSRKGKKQIGEILDKRQEGISWYEIADSIYSLSSDETRLADIDTYKIITDVNEVMASIKLAKKEGQKAKEYLNAVMDGKSAVYQLEEAELNKRKEAKEQLKKQKLLIESPQKKED